MEQDNNPIRPACVDEQLAILQGYFPHLNEKQIKQFSSLYELYADWNAKINVISRKDIENLYLHYVLHSLGITAMLHFKDGSSVMDLGTGGGFPGIPLAILFPNVKFHLVDSIGKKIKVCADIAENIGLKNVETVNARVEEEKRKFDFVVSRAAMVLSDISKLALKNIAAEQRNPLPNGFITLKGGEMQGEMMPFRSSAELFDVSDYFEGEFFQTKHILYLPVKVK